MNTLATISSPYFLLGRPQGSQQQDLLPERKTANNENIDSQDDRQRPATESVLRGELLDSVITDKRCQALYNQNADPKNRSAISTYLSVDTSGSEPGSPGRLIDKYI